MERSLGDRIARAGRLLDLARHQEAELELRGVLSRQPDHRMALTLLAGVLLDTGRGDEAATAAQRLVDAHPDDPAGYQLLAWQRGAAGQSAEAERLLQRSLELDPGSAASRRMLARVLGGQPERATAVAQELERVLAHAPDDWETVLPLVSALAGQERWDQAENACLAAVARSPDRPEYRVALLCLRVARGGFEEGRGDLLDALRERPEGYPFDQVVQALEWMGIPEELSDLYPVLCGAAGLPDLTEPGAAGDDPALLQRQAELAGRLWAGGRLADGGDHPAPDPTHERVRDLVEAVLAADPSNPLGRELRAHLL